MAFEVEIKARVADPEALRKLLEERYGAGQAYYKSDKYFSPVGVEGILHNPADPAFRLRVEQNERNASDEAYVTAKKKSMSSGVEINEEIEFEVSDPEAFSAFAAMQGYAVSFEKTKRGYVWAPERAIRIELAEVGGLGYFVEIEEMVDSMEGVTNGVGGVSAEARVRKYLASLGFDDRHIEPRYYTEMLCALLPAGGE